MSVICPTVLADQPHTYREQMERIAPFAKRLQIDLTDGDFAPGKTVDLDHVWWPEGAKADIHLMYARPMQQLEKLIDLKPDLVIIHAEAELDKADHAAFADSLHRNDIKAGLCLLKQTSVESVGKLLNKFDHLLIFGGKLGSFGGTADLKLSEKSGQAKAVKPDIEIGWDGGVNDRNARQLAEAGIDVLNVGGFIQKSENPEAAYDKLLSIVEGNDRTAAGK